MGVSLCTQDTRLTNVWLYEACELKLITIMLCGTKVLLYESRWFLTFIWNEMWFYFDHWERPVDCFVCLIEIVREFGALTIRKWSNQVKKTKENLKCCTTFDLCHSHTWWAQKQREGAGWNADLWSCWWSDVAEKRCLCHQGRTCFLSPGCWGISDMKTFSLSVIDSCFQGELSF